MVAIHTDPQPRDPLNAARGILLGVAVSVAIWTLSFGALFVWLAYWR